MTPELTDNQRTELEADLAALQESLEALLEATESGSKPVVLKENAGRLSRMDEMHNQSILLANRNVTTNRLKEVRRAMTRVEDGYFGICIECEESIAFARLKAYPEAPMCIACQSVAEGDD